MACYKLFSKGSLTNDSLDFDIDINKLPPIHDAEKIVDDINGNKYPFLDYEIDDLLEFFHYLSIYWRSNKHPLKKYNFLGLNYLSAWLCNENLKNISNISIRNNRYFLDSFHKNNPSDKYYLRAQPMGIAGHWIAGNIPILGIISLVQSILTKNLNIVRVSKRFGNILPQIINSFNDIEFTNKKGKVISGKDISKTVNIIYYDKDDISFANALSQKLNSRVVWGGQEAVEAISGLKKSIDCVDIIFGPKYSYSIIDKSFLCNEKIAKTISQKLAFDISAYEQRGCNSPHTLFIEKEGKVSVEEFCKFLGEGLEKALLLIPKEELDPSTVAKILNLRAEYSFTGLVESSEGTKWTVLYSPEEKGIAEPCYGRTIFIRAVDSIFDILKDVNHNHQSVGIAIEKSIKMNFVEQLSHKGVSRCPDIGSMSLYEIPWDGMFPMEKMIRWVSVYD